MNYYGYPPGYTPVGLAPAQPAPTIPANVRRRAYDQGATHLSPDGKRAYVSRFGRWHYSDYDGVEFGSWWRCDGEPGEMVEV